MPDPPVGVECRPVSRAILADEDLFTTDAAGRETVNLALLKEHFFDEGRLGDEQALRIIKRAEAVLRKEPNLLEVDTPITSTGPHKMWWLTG